MNYRVSYTDDPHSAVVLQAGGPREAAHRFCIENDRASEGEVLVIPEHGPESRFQRAELCATTALLRDLAPPNEQRLESPAVAAGPALAAGPARSSTVAPVSSPLSEVPPAPITRRSGWSLFLKVTGVICAIGGFIGLAASDRDADKLICTAVGFGGAIQSFFLAFLIDVITDIRWFLKTLVETAEKPKPGDAGEPAGRSDSSLP